MRDDVAARPIAWTALAIAVTVATVIGSVRLLLHAWDTPAGASRVALPDPVAVPGPLLQSAPQLDLAQYRAEKQRLLDSAAWVDPARGIARIPIADAMALLAASAASAPRAPERHQ